MTVPNTKPIASVQLSPESARVLESSIAAGTSGAAFWLLQGIGAIAVAALFLASLGVALYSGAAALGGQEGAPEIAGFALLVATPLGIALAFQASFLRRLLQRRRG